LKVFTVLFTVEERMYFTIYDCVEFFEEFMTVYCESHQYIHEKLISKFCYEELNQNGYTHII